MNDFLNDPAIHERIRAGQKRAIARVPLSRTANEKPSLGDGFLFDESLEIPVQWIAIRQHRDEPSLWYMIAADECPLIGTCDIALPECNEYCPLVLRCNFGFWAHEQDMDTRRYVGRISGECLLDAQDRLSEMVHGDIPASSAAMEVDEDPAYVEWGTTLRSACDRIEDRIQSEPVVVNLSDARSDWGASLNLAAEQPSQYLDLAADSGGQIKPEETTSGLRLTSRLPGMLFAVISGQSCDLQYSAESPDDEPPRVFVDGQPDFVGKWERKPGSRWLCRTTILLASDRVQIRVGSEKFLLCS